MGGLPGYTFARRGPAEVCGAAEPSSASRCAASLHAGSAATPLHAAARLLHALTVCAAAAVAATAAGADAAGTSADGTSQLRPPLLARATTWCTGCAPVPVSSGMRCGTCCGHTQHSRQPQPPQVASGRRSLQPQLLPHANVRHRRAYHSLAPATAALPPAYMRMPACSAVPRTGWGAVHVKHNGAARQQTFPSAAPSQAGTATIYMCKSQGCCVSSRCACAGPQQTRTCTLFANMPGE